MVKLQKGKKPRAKAAPPVLPDRDWNEVALTAWLDALLQHATARQVVDRLLVVGERLEKGKAWLAERDTSDPRYDEGYTLYRTLEIEQEQLALNLRGLRKVGWYWCGMTHEAAKLARPGWGDGITEPADTSTPEAIWRGLWGDDPPADWPLANKDFYVERRIGAIEYWNLEDMRERWERMAA